MKRFEHSLPVEMTTIDASTGKVEKVETVKMGIMPPPAGKCPVCGVAHEPHLFHDWQSLFYQYAFYGRQKRWPTWADASAHCTPDVVKALKSVLACNGLAWSAPADGVAVVVGLGDKEVA